MTAMSQLYTGNFHYFTEISAFHWQLPVIYRNLPAIFLPVSALC